MKIKYLEIKVLVLVMISTSVLVSATSYAQEIAMQRVISFSRGVVVSQAVRNECKLQTKVPYFIKHYANQHGIALTLADKNVQRLAGRKLLVTIVHASSNRGGPWSGTKALTLAGTLKDGNRTIARFTAGRNTNGGFFGGYKGTCSLLGRNAKRIGKDVALWLLNPKNGAHLGNITPDQRPRTQTRY